MKIGIIPRLSIPESDQRFPLFIIRKQLYLEGFKHNIDTTIQRIMVSQFLPHLKKWASLRLEIVIHEQG
jgi:hypothetical protein